MRRALAIPLLISTWCACCALAGCEAIANQMHEHVEDFKFHVSHKRLADDAWASVEHICGDHPHADDFEDGYKEGYYDRASGFRGCPPPVPPKKYWSVHYQGPEGAEQIFAWFEGYRVGVMAAEHDGVSDLSRLPSSIVEPPPMELIDVEAAPAPMEVPPPAPGLTAPDDDTMSETAPDPTGPLVMSIGEDVLQAGALPVDETSKWVKTSDQRREGRAENQPVDHVFEVESGEMLTTITEEASALGKPRRKPIEASRPLPSPEPAEPTPSTASIRWKSTGMATQNPGSPKD